MSQGVGGWTGGQEEVDSDAVGARRIVMSLEYPPAR